MGERLEVLIADYQRTSEMQKLLVDIRFRLLAFVPTVTGIGITVLKDRPGISLGAAVLGFIVTLGIIMYEIRNSQIHDAAAHRLKALSSWLDLPPAGPQGLRPKPERLLGLKIWHDRALGLIYGASLGAWAALLAYSIPGWQHARSWTSVLVALLVGSVAYTEMIRINNKTHNTFGDDVPALPPSWSKLYTDTDAVAQSDRPD